jgi:nitrate reductase (NAD(P)H)
MNRTEEDILLRSELDGIIAKIGPERSRLHHTLTRPSSTWTGSVGHICNATIQEHFPAPSDDGVVLMCGPGGMVDAVTPVLQRVGWNIDSQVIVF